MKVSATKGDKLFNTINILLVSLIALIILYPLIFVVNASFSDPTRIYEVPLLLYPRGLNVEGYKEVLKSSDIWTGFRNAVIYTGLGTVINLIVTTIAAYPLSRSGLRGKRFFTLFFTITMFFSGGLIPTYLVNQQLGIVNTLWVMILPGALGVYNMILMRTYFSQNIPNDLIESAYIDGANDLWLLWKVVLPLATPIIAVMAMFYGVGRWNAYFDALIYLQDRAKYPLQIILREILVQGQFGQDMNQIIAGSAESELLMLKMTLKYSVVIVSSLPVLLFYPVVAKYFEKGILVGSIKGCGGVSMLKAIAAFCELVYDMMLLNVYWWRYMLLGGVLFSLIPATITVYDCIRKRILQKNEAPLKEIFSDQYRHNKQKNRWFHVAAIVLTGFVIGVHHTLASDYPTNFLFEFTMRTNLLIILLLAITFFPVHAYFSLDKVHRWLQPLLFVFICPVQLLISMGLLGLVSLLYCYYPFLGICLGIGLPAYGIGFLFFNKFNKMKGVYF